MVRISRRSILGYVFVSLFILTLPIIPSQAQGTKVIVDPPFIADTSLGPDTTFTIAIVAINVPDLWGWQFTLTWDPGVITPIDFNVAPPFTQSWPSEIGVGEATIAYSMSLGVPSGVYGNVTLATFTFWVRDYGSTFLRLEQVLLVDTEGWLLPHEVEHGFFTNVEPKYRVEVQRTYAEHRDWSEIMDIDNTLTTNLRNFGSVTTEAKVVFTFADEAATWSYSEVIPVTLNRKEKLAVPLTISRSWLLLRGAPPPVYGTYYVTVKVLYHDLELDLWLQGRLVKTLSFTLSP